MKSTSIKVISLISFALAFNACSSNGKVMHLDVTAIKQLYEPENNKAIILQSSESAKLYFEWEPAKAEDSGTVLYEIAFDRADGDFSDPIHVIASDNNGSANYATISHKEINKIAAKGERETTEQTTLKWTIFSSKGYNIVKAEEVRTLIVTRLEGFADIPSKLYLTGEATEAGTDLSKALIMKKITEGEFEIYTKLTEGKSFKFVCAINETSTEYALSDEKIIEGGTSTVVKTGIYKYSLDFNTGSFKTKEISKVNLFLNRSQKKIELIYDSFGVWKRTDFMLSGLQEGDNTDDRYKFRMESSTGETEWRAINNDSKPTGNEAYYYMVEKTNVDQWTDNEIWKNAATDGWNDKSYDISFSLNTEGPYTHNLVIKK